MVIRSGLVICSGLIVRRGLVIGRRLVIDSVSRSIIASVIASSVIPWWGSVKHTWLRIPEGWQVSVG